MKTPLSNKDELRILDTNAYVKLGALEDYKKSLRKDEIPGFGHFIALFEKFQNRVIVCKETTREEYFVLKGEQHDFIKQKFESTKPTAHFQYFYVKVCKRATPLDILIERLTQNYENSAN